MTLTVRTIAVRPLFFDEPFGTGLDRHVHVRAASAVVALGDVLVIAQDDSAFAVLLGPDGSVRPLRIFSDPAGDTFDEARGNKRFKPDFESGTQLELDGETVAVFFGSGSLAARRRAAIVHRDASGFRAELVALPSLYEAAEAALGLDERTLNIEGACTLPGVVRFFQRGNAAGGRGVNATFDVAAEALLAALRGDRRLVAADLTRVRRYSLGTFNGSGLGFTAAESLPDGRVLFAAAAEASPNTYDDAPCAGSVIGLIDVDGTIQAMTAIAQDETSPVKVEAIVLVEAVGPVMRGVALTDPDDPRVPARRFDFELSIDSQTP